MREIIITLLALFIWESNFGQINKGIKLTNEEKIFGLSQIWKEVDYNFPLLDKYDLDWDSLYLETIPEVLKTKDTDEYYQVLKRFLCVFHEGHTTVVPPSKPLNYGVIDLAIKYIDSNFFIVGVGKSINGKVRLGDRVIKINGIDVKKLIDSVYYPYHHYDKRIVYNMATNTLLYGPLNKSLYIEFEREKSSFIINIKRKKKFGEWDSYKTISSRTYFKYKKYDDIAYVKIGTFSSYKIIEQFERYIDSLKNSKGIIIDLRNNFGGTSYGYLLAKYFISDTSFVNGIRVTKEHNAYLKAQGALNDTNIRILIKLKQKLDTVNKYSNYYNGTNYDTTVFTATNTERKSAGIFRDKKLVVLINNYTASAAETFLLTLQYNSIGTIIGTGTYGSTGQPLIVPLPGGGYAKIITNIPLTNNGKYYNYILPDIQVNLTIEDYLQKNDRVLLNAIKYINQN